MLSVVTMIVGNTNYKTSTELEGHGLTYYYTAKEASKPTHWAQLNNLVILSLKFTNPYKVKKAVESRTVLPKPFCDIHPNGSNTMFLFKSHIWQHLSASVCEFFNFPWFWIAFRTKGLIWRQSLLGYLFILTLRVAFVHLLGSFSLHCSPLPGTLPCSLFAGTYSCSSFTSLRKMSLSSESDTWSPN